MYLSELRSLEDRAASTYGGLRKEGRGGGGGGGADSNRDLSCIVSTDVVVLITENII